MATVLAFERLTKLYPRGLRGSVRALDDFTLSIEEGEIVGFIGANGAGKTTAMHIAMGFMQPSSGGGHLFGLPFGRASARRRVGFVSEQVAFYNRSVASLVRFYGSLDGMAGPDLVRRMRQILDRLGLSSEAGRRATKLSRGTLQRLGLAQALVHSPDLLVLDEPASALDPAAKIQVRDLLTSFRDAGGTVFLSSHQLSDLEVISDRIAMIDRGRMIRSGKLQNLISSRGEFRIQATGLSIEAARSFWPEAMVRDGTLSFRVPTAAQRDAIERIWAMGGKLESVEPERKNLEAIFLEAMKGREDSGSKERS